MANNLLNKLLMKIFNKDKYSAYKFKKNSDKKLDFYNQNIKDELKKRTQDAYEKGIFGAPTFYINNKVFWGQDRLEFALAESLK